MWNTFFTNYEARISGTEAQAQQQVQVIPQPISKVQTSAMMFQLIFNKELIINLFQTSASSILPKVTETILGKHLEDIRLSFYFGPCPISQHGGGGVYELYTAASPYFSCFYSFILLWHFSSCGESRWVQFLNQPLGVATQLVTENPVCKLYWCVQWPAEGRLHWTQLISQWKKGGKHGWMQSRFICS